VRAYRMGAGLALICSVLSLASCDGRPAHTASAPGGVRVGDLLISGGYVAAPVVEHVTTAYLAIENIGTESDALVDAGTDLAGRVRFDSQVLSGPLGRSSTVTRITIEPGRKMVLQPGGYHLTLEDLRVSLAPGDSVTLQLRFERAGRATVRLPVLSPVELVRLDARSARAEEAVG